VGEKETTKYVQHYKFHKGQKKYPGKRPDRKRAQTMANPFQMMDAHKSVSLQYLILTFYLSGEAN
jgi:hypothetical protein